MGEGVIKSSRSVERGFWPNPNTPTSHPLPLATLEPPRESSPPPEGSQGSGHGVPGATSGGGPYPITGYYDDLLPNPPPPAAQPLACSATLNLLLPELPACFFPSPATTPHPLPPRQVLPMFFSGPAARGFYPEPQRGMGGYVRVCVYTLLAQVSPPHRHRVCLYETYLDVPKRT